jgi:hypothetical protein
LLTKKLEKNYSNYFFRALNASRLIFLWNYHQLLLHWSWTFQIPWREELPTSVENMKLFIQRQLGQRFNVPFIIRFSEIRSEGQVIVTLQYAKQKKYELMEDYYDQFMWLCVVILQ